MMFTLTLARLLMLPPTIFIYPRQDIRDWVDGQTARRWVKRWLDDWAQRAVANGLCCRPLQFSAAICPIQHLHQWPGGGDAAHPHQISR